MFITMKSRYPAFIPLVFSLGNAVLRFIPVSPALCKFGDVGKPVASTGKDVFGRSLMLTFSVGVLHSCVWRSFPNLAYCRIHNSLYGKSWQSYRRNSCCMAEQQLPYISATGHR